MRRRGDFMPKSRKYTDVRKDLIFKANELIQKSRFSLTLQQQKIILYLISQITPCDEDFKLYEFSIVDFCKVCGIDYDNGKNYADLKNDIKEIADRSIWVKLPNGQDTVLRWIEKAYISENSGIIQIKLDKDLKPYLLQLKEFFTQSELFLTLKFNSKYSMRLYELIKSIYYNESDPYEQVFSLEELKGLLGAETYPTYQKFKDRALEPALKEINEYSDKLVSYQPIKHGRSFTEIKLIIKENDPLESTLERLLEKMLP